MMPSGTVCPELNGSNHVPSQGSRPCNCPRSALLTPPESPPASRWAHPLDDATHPSGLTTILSWGQVRACSLWLDSDPCVHCLLLSPHSLLRARPPSRVTCAQTWQLPKTPSHLVHSHSALRSLDFHLCSHCLGQVPPCPSCSRR